MRGEKFLNPPLIRLLLGDLILIINAQAVAGQEKFRWENQTKDIGKKKGGVRGVISQTQKRNRRCKVMPSDRM